MRLFLFTVQPVDNILPYFLIEFFRRKETEQEDEYSPAGADTDENEQGIDKVENGESDITHTSSAFLFFPVEKRAGNRKRRRRTTTQMIRAVVRAKTRKNTRTAIAYTRTRSIHITSLFLWMRGLESNKRLYLTMVACYHYTTPQYIF